MVNIALRKDFVICIPNSLWISLHAPWMALNVIRVTIVPFQCNRFCRKSLSAVCTISYALFSEIIIWFFQSSPVFAKTSELKLPSSGQSVTYLIWTRAGSLEWCLLTIAKHFTLSTMNYYWRNWRHMASLIRSLNGVGLISPEWKGVK